MSLLYNLKKTVRSKSNLVVLSRSLYSNSVAENPTMHFYLKSKKTIKICHMLRYLFSYMIPVDTAIICFT